MLKSNNPCIPEELFYQMIKSIDLSNYGYARHFKFLKDTLIVIPEKSISGNFAEITKTSVYKGYKQDKIEMRGDRAEMSDFPLYLNTVAGGLDRRDQTIGGFSFVVKIYAVPVVEIIG